jgi:uracil-DNA glycosylase family 4
MNPYCAHCPRRYDTTLPGKQGACRSDGDLESKILIVGMSPGEHELGSIPFVGPAGALLWSSARAAGFSRPDCRIVNTCNCWPIGNKGKNLSDQQIGACWDRFNEDVKNSKAEVVVCLGGDALTRVTGLHKIERYRGYLLSVEHLQKQEIVLPVQGQYKTSRKCSFCHGEEGSRECPECFGTGWKYRKGDDRILREKVEIEPVLPPKAKYVIATYHPSFVMRMGKKPLRAFLNDLNRAQRAVDDALEIEKHHWSDTPIEIARTGDDLIAFDIENVGGLEGAIERISLSGPRGTWSDSWTHPVREATKYELGDPDRIKIAHNIQHDLKHLEADGVNVPGKIFCTMWGGMALEPDLPMGLRSMAPLWLDIHGCWKDENRNDPPYYNAMDSAYDRSLAKALIERHKALGSYEPLMKFVMPALRVLLDMHRTGMHVDLPWLGGFHKRLTDRLMRVEKVWEESAPGVNPGSHKDVHAFLYGTLGMPVMKDPDNGFKPTSAAWALRILLNRYPEYAAPLRALLAYRKIEKLLDCCAITLGSDGAVHPRFGPTFKDEPDAFTKRKGTTSTMRLSVSADGGLNMQQVQKFARRMYVPPPGFVFLEVDLDRAEPSIIAASSNDLALLKELDHGDPYLRLAEDAGCDRQTAKILFLARTYGAGAPKGKIILAKKGIDVDTKAVSRVFATMAKLYPRVEWYRNQKMQEMLRSGRLTTGFGFVREFLGGDADVPEALDWLCQHPVAVILLSLLVPMHSMAKSFGGWLAITVYDSLVVCVPKESSSAVSKAMLDIVRTERPEVTPGFRPRASQVKMGSNWRDLH